MAVRYWGIDDLDVPEGAPDLEAFIGLLRGEFNDEGMLLDQLRWNQTAGKWVPTNEVGDWFFMGEGWLTEIDEARAMAWIEATRVLDENGAPVEGLNFHGIETYLLQLPHDEAWSFNFNFGQWQNAAVDDDIVGYCQVLRLDDSNWWIEFSSDEFNNPKLTDRQKQAILDAGFDEPDEVESPNFWLKMADPTAKHVIALIEDVLTKGGFAE